MMNQTSKNEVKRMNELTKQTKGWYPISISKKNLAELEKIGEQLKEKGIGKEPRRKKEVSFDRIIQELIRFWKEFHRMR